MNYNASPDEPTSSQVGTERPDAPGNRAIAVQILEAFREGIDRPRTRPLYQLNLLLIAIVMVLLPVLYLALVVLMAVGVWLWAGTGTAFFDGGHGLVLRGILYLGPLVGGVTAIVFMFKPLFAKRPSPPQALAINPGAEPVLYSFLCRMSEVMGTPVPSAIELSASANASASLRYGLFGRDLTLTIGLPLAGAFTLQEISGVIAHEFGHFTQGAGMRLSTIIRRINGWFARVVYERDAWDEYLDQLGEESAWWGVVFIAWVSRAAVGLSRLALRCLMGIGHVVSASAMRQMEFEADEFGARVAGSRAYESVLLRLSSLGFVEQAVWRQVFENLQKANHLPDDIPGLVCKAEAEIPSGLNEEIQTRAGLESTGWLSTHPSLGDRLKRVRRLQAPGVLSIDYPATSLFQDFKVISQQVTLLLYRENLGLSLAATPITQVAAQ